MAESIDPRSPRAAGAAPSSGKGLNYTLWTLQVLLALLFLFAGGSKLAVPAAALTKQTTLPVGFMRFIGVCEALGGLGLILPGLLKIRTGLTPLAAAGLVIIMIGATVVTLQTAGPGPGVLVPIVVGLLAAFIAYGRWKLAPLPRR